MRTAILWAIAVGAGLVSIGGCGAGKDPTHRPGVSYGGAGSGGTPSTGAGTHPGGSAGSEVGGGAPTGGRVVGGDGGRGGGEVTSTGGASPGGGGGALPAGAPSVGGSVGGEGGSGAIAAGGSWAGAAGAGTGGYDVTVGVGEICSAHADCGAGQICYDGLNVERRSCRVQCDVSSVGAQDSCGEGELCVARQGGGLAACLRVCEPFQTSSDCENDEYCYPNPDPGYTGGEVVSGLCLAAGSGTAEAGESCESSICADGLTCYQPAYDALGNDHCERTCDPGAAAGEAGACPTGQTCRESLVGDAACLQLCQASGDDCDAGEWCAPFYDWDGVPVVEGHCVQPGSLGAGDECDPGECAEGLVCARMPPPYEAAWSCRVPCDPDGDPCSDGAACVDILDGATGYGTCEPPCTRFEEGPPGCESGEWCAPTHLGNEAGTCVAEGTVAEGDPCAYSSECAAGQFCDCRFGFNGNCQANAAECVAACIPGATGNDPGACAAGQTCTALWIYGQVSAFGVCREPCDYDGDSACTDSEETCVPGELLPDGADACVDVPADAPSFGTQCWLLGVDDGDVCGETALCLIPEEPDAPATCEDVCRDLPGAPIGSSPHPDCQDPGDTCTEIEAGLAYGRCL